MGDPVTCVIIEPGQSLPAWQNRRVPSDLLVLVQGPTEGAEDVLLRLRSRLAAVANRRARLLHVVVATSVRPRSDRAQLACGLVALLPSEGSLTFALEDDAPVEAWSHLSDVVETSLLPAGPSVAIQALRRRPLRYQWGTTRNSQPASQRET